VLASAQSTNPHFCKTWFNVHVNLLLPVHVSFALITLARLQAAFYFDKQLMIIVGLLFGSQIVTLTVMLAVFASGFEVVVLPAFWTGCIPWNTAVSGWVMWIPLAINEGVLFLVVAIGGSRLIRRRVGIPPVVRVILLDSLVYVTVQLALMMFNNFALNIPNVAFATFPAVLVSMASTLGCRMLLNVHGALDRGSTNQLITSSAISLRSMQFAA